MPEEFKPQYNFTDDRLNELKQLFPESWEDGVFNVDTLKTLIGDFSTDNTVKEHFGLNWVGKQDARKIAAKPPTGTLKPCLGEGVNEDTTENIFIEGENLEVLKILRKSYMGKIKMIYIDPPYNTGNDFIYNDTFADSTEDYLRKTGEKSDEGLLVSNPKSSGKYHANWLSFMHPRLRLAKDLLKDDGVIFISIDDNEVDNLRLLCDEIYGTENFLGQLVWKKKYIGGKHAKHFVDLHEYVLVYAKNSLSIDEIIMDRPKAELEKFKMEDEYITERGKFYIRPLKSNLGLRKTLIYPIEMPDGKVLETQWMVSKDTLEDLKKDGRIIFKMKRDGSYNIYRKYYEKDGGGKVKVPTLIEDVANADGKVEIKKIFEIKEGRNIPFDNPKPTKLIKHLIKPIANSEGDIVLDFFAGSGTTADSVAQLNIEDSINRKFIIVQIGEKCNNNGYENISDITKDRVRKSIDKSQGFKVYKQDTSTIYKWQDFKSEQDGALPDLFSKMELAYKNPLQDGVTTQDFITEVILQEGFPLTAKQEEVASGIFKIAHEWLPYTLYTTMLYSFKNTDFRKLQLQDTDHFVCLDKAFEGNDALKQGIDNQCKLFTI